MYMHIYTYVCVCIYIYILPSYTISYYIYNMSDLAPNPRWEVFSRLWKRDLIEQASFVTIIIYIYIYICISLSLYIYIYMYVYYVCT